jgi:serine/threonine protein kinase
MSEPGQLVAARYRLRQLIGEGGMGRVWLGHDEMLERDIAVKEVAPPLRSPWSTVDDLCHGLVNEARTAAQLTNPHVVHVHDLLHWGGRPWIVMEYVPSRSLSALIYARGGLAPGYVATVALALLDGLTSAHRLGILHRDVTPRNVLIGHDGRILLTDFGLASWRAHGLPADRYFYGTIGYVAPERVVHGVSSPEGDLWSLGATLYAAVEGQAPFARPSAADALDAVLFGSPEPPRHAGPLEPVLRGLLARDPGARLRPPAIRQLLLRATEPPVAPAGRPRAGWRPGSADRAMAPPRMAR